MDEQPFRVISHQGRLVLAGAVDADGVARLREALAERAADPTPLREIDLRQVTYLPSVGVAVLTRALGAAQRRGAALDLVVGPGTMAERVLSLAGLSYRTPEGVDDLDEDRPA